VADEQSLDAVPYHLQGDLSMYDVEQLNRRFANRSSPAVQAVLQDFWGAGTSSAAVGAASDPARHGWSMPKETYVALMCKVCKRLLPDYRYDDALEIAEDAWQTDTKGSGVLSRAALGDSLFELADMCARALDARRPHRAPRAPADNATYVTRPRHALTAPHVPPPICAPAPR
jgi:hypothetical protein